MLNQDQVRVTGPALVDGAARREAGIDSLRSLDMSKLPIVNWEFVTPEAAAFLLRDENNDHNRSRRPNVVSAHAKAMVTGNFCGDNCETIKISTKGKLLDGQHRLGGIVEAGQGVILLVARGIREEVVPTIDVGVKKTVSDIFQMDGEVHTKHLAAAICRLHAIRNGITLVGSQHLLPAYQCKEILAAEPEFRNSVVQMQEVRRVCAVPLAAALHYIFSVDKGQKERADQFFSDLASGENLPSDDAVYVLRERLIRARHSKGRLSLDELATFIINAWNRRINNTPTDVIRGKIKVTTRNGKKVNTVRRAFPPIADRPTAQAA